MKRPASIKIFGQKYKIRYDYANEENYGETDPSVNIIWIRNAMPADKLVRVLMHEITHAVIFETPMADRKRFDVEEVCDIVGFHILDTLKDNPEVLQYILREMEDEIDEQSI